MGRIRAALQFEWTQITFDLLRPVEQRSAVMNPTGGSEQLALRTHIDVVFGIEGEDRPVRECHRHAGICRTPECAERCLFP